jgi:hypothetical protein
MSSKKTSFTGKSSAGHFEADFGSFIPAGDPFACQSIFRTKRIKTTFSTADISTEIGQGRGLELYGNR